MNYKLYLSLLAAVLLIFIINSSSQVFGDKSDVLREIDNNFETVTINHDEDSLNIALAVQKAIHNVAKTVSPSVVNIRTERIVAKGNKANPHIQEYFDFFGDNFGFQNGPQKLQYLGSGFVISKSGYIVTNNHVVQNADEITVFFSNEKEYKGRIIGQDHKTDIAVIKIDPKHNLPVTSLGNSDKVKIGDFAIAIGNPFGFKGSFTFGVVSAQGRDNVDQDAGLKNYIQTDASINQGNSGGPLLNIYGQAIGMNTAIYSTTGGSMGIGFAIPMNIVKRVAKSLIENGVVDRGYLGVNINDIPEDIAKDLGIENKQGIYVQDVEKDGPADNGGMKAGDVITQVNNKAVSSISQLQRIISSYHKGDKIEITVLRNKNKLNLTVSLGELKGNKIVRKGARPFVGKSLVFLDLVVASVKDNYSYFRIEKDLSGVVVVDLDEDSLSYKQGFRPGDVIQMINFDEINNMDDFRDFAEKNKNVKASFLFKLVRRNRNHFITVENK